MTTKDMLILILMFVLFQIHNNECNCPCSWSSNGATLDLSAFVEMPIDIEGTDSFGEKYRYSPCTNKYYQDNRLGGYLYSMVSGTYGQYAIFPGNVYDNPAVYNNGIWSFKYSTGYTHVGGCGYNVKLDILWICNNTINEYPYYNFIDVKELFPCIFQMEIESYYACNTTIQPSPMETIQKKQCIWNYNNYVLNLTDLYGEILGYDKCSGVCSYSVCTDNSPVINPINQWQYQCGMIVNGNPQNSVYAFWDPEVEPVYNDDNETWTFQYRSIYSGYATNDNNAMIHWFCGSQRYYVVSVVSEVNQKTERWRIWNISSSYACVEKQRFCVFTDGINQLNLTTIAGKEIHYLDDDELYSYIYTPCSNDVACDNINVMSMKWNINTRKCQQNLAIWEDNYDNVNYIGGIDKQWKFEYQNGEICVDNINTNFTIYWECNTSANNWKVTQFKEINECDYQMTIQSALVC
eukprot:431029_1